MKLFYNISSVHPWSDTRIYFRQAFTHGETGKYKVKHIAIENNLIPGNTPPNIAVELLPKRPKKKRMLTWIPLYKKIKKDKPDVIQFHDPELLILMKIISWIPHYRPVIVYDMHENVPKVLMRKNIPGFALNMYRQLERQLLKSCSGVVFAESTYKDDYRFLTCPTMDVYNYPKVPFMKENVAKGDVFTFIYLGSISAIRGGETMLLLAKRLVELKKTFHMKIIGTGSEKYIGQLRTFILDNDLAEYVTLEGGMAFDKAFEAIQRAHVGMAFLVPNPNFIGGKTTKCFEYMAGGIPFMVSDFLIQDELDRWNCGVSVDVSNIDDVVQKAVDLLDFPDKAAHMGERGKTAYKKEYNWEKEEGKLRTLFDKLESCS
ncbi:hypothetical protein [Peribacillus muralis]|uniref:hypothetical protein n=1 Tax=Peribacillus muralis TaxID=264697 RepID=UPI003CFFCD7E